MPSQIGSRKGWAAVGGGGSAGGADGEVFVVRTAGGNDVRVSEDGDDCEGVAAVSIGDGDEAAASSSVTVILEVSSSPELKGISVTVTCATSPSPSISFKASTFFARGLIAASAAA